MADLNITAANPAAGAKVPVVIQLVDVNRRPISAFHSGLGFVVSRLESRTEADGTLTVDIPANDTTDNGGSFDTANTRYLVSVGEFTRKINKSSSTQTLEEATVDDPEDLDTEVTYATSAQLTAHIDDTTDAHDASAISTVPAGNLAATNVQTSLAELDSEKVAKAGDTMTGLLSVPRIRGTGTGSPEGVVTAGIGAVYLRTDGTAGTVLYVKESGAGNTGWVAYSSGGYTDEQAQDAVGAILVDGTTIDFTYSDGTPSITAEVIDGTITSTKIANDTIVNADVNTAAAIAGSKLQAATTTNSGAVELATTAETQTGTDTDRAVTPAGASGTYAPIASPTFTGIATTPVAKVSGITGAATAFRFVGANSSGAPASGTFIANDIAIDLLGRLWLCTTGGSPGTWVQATGILASTDYNPATSVAFTSTSTTFADVDATNAAITFTAPASGSVLIRATFMAQTTSNNTQLGVNLRDGGGDVANTVKFALFATSANQAVQSACTWKLTGLTPGTSYTYKLGFARLSGTANAVINAGQSTSAGSLNMEAWAA